MKNNILKISIWINKSKLPHNDNGDNMNQKDLWLLFKSTGKIEYYLKYKNYKDENEGKLEDAQQSWRNSY